MKYITIYTNENNKTVIMIKTIFGLSTATLAGLTIYSNIPSSEELSESVMNGKYIFFNLILNSKKDKMFDILTKKIAYSNKLPVTSDEWVCAMRNYGDSSLDILNGEIQNISEYSQRTKRMIGQQVAKRLIALKQTFDSTKNFRGLIFTGTEFNQLFNDIQHYKYINYPSMLHYGHEYKLGLNEDSNIFNTKTECSEGGLYFTDYKNIGNFGMPKFGMSDRKLYYASVPNDDATSVYIEAGKAKASKLIISEYTKDGKSVIIRDRDFF